MGCSSWVHILFWCWVLLPLALGSKARHFKWEVSYLFWSPDCMEKVLIGINQQFPGPTIKANAGDTIVVELTNKLPTEGVVIHWHGIRQFGTPWADGTASISQCAIDPDETFVYRFIVDKPGTYFYHGHYGMQRSAGLYGLLIVDVPSGQSEPFHYDGELNLLLSDWWHMSVQEQMISLSSYPFRWIGEPQSLLMNGKGQYNCSYAASYYLSNGSPAVMCKIKKSECPLHVMNVRPNKAYRLRIISTTALSSLHFAIGKQNEMSPADLGCSPVWLGMPVHFTREMDSKRCAGILRPNSYLLLDPLADNYLQKGWFPATGSLWLPEMKSVDMHHKMTIVEADGNYVEPVTVDNLDIYSGESYSVLITTDQNPTTNYWASVHVRGRPPKTPPGLALLNYLPNHPTKLPNSPPPVPPRWDDFDYSKSFSKKILSKLTHRPKPPLKSDRRITLLNTQNKIDGYTKWAINNISLVLPTTPYLASIKHSIKNAFDDAKPPENYPRDYDIMIPPENPNSTYGSNVYRLGMRSTVDVILQNANALTENVSEVHPWHLHGHDFWVLGYGDGRFEEERDVKSFNVENPPLKNTAVVFPYGWTALRFVADNPGVWAFHCHIEPHLHMGMGVVFAEGVELAGDIPANALGCGMTRSIVVVKHP